MLVDSFETIICVGFGDEQYSKGIIDGGVRWELRDKQEEAKIHMVMVALETSV